MRFPIFLFLLLSPSFSLIAQTDAYEKIRGICVYIDYPDAPALIGHEQLDSLLNGLNYSETGVNRTFRKYWLQETRRNIDVTHDIFFYRAPNTAEHYSNVTWQEGIEMWRDALESVISENPGYDWSQLSTHPNGRLREVMILSSSTIPAGVGGAHWPFWQLSNGINIIPIHGSFIKYPSQAFNNLFVICHESGHSMFDFPDTYDTGVNSSGTGSYSLMSGQGPDVPPVGAPFLEIRNWGHNIELEEEGEHTITLRADGDSILVYKNPHSAAEFFTVEARKKSTLGNSKFPVSLGLMIWHTDDNITTSNTLYQMTPEQHYRHSVEQADGLFQLESPNGIQTDAGDIYIPGDSFTDTTMPDSKWWNGEASGFEVKDIQFVGDDKIQFTVSIPELHETHYDEIPKADFQLIESTPAQIGFEAEKAFDDDVSTYYHVPWGSNEPRPHEVSIFLGDEYLVSEVYYQANDNFSPPWEGRVGDYFISLSENGFDYEAIAAGSLKRTRYEQYIPTNLEVGSYLKFSALNSLDNDSRTSIAELSIRGIRTDLLGIEDYEKASFLEVHPNPTSHLLNVESESTEIGDLLIFDFSGKMLKREVLNKSMTIDVSDLPNGVYILVAKSGKVVDYKRFVKQ